MLSLAAGMVATGVRLQLSAPATRLAAIGMGCPRGMATSRLLALCGCNLGEPVRRREALLLGCDVP